MQDERLFWELLQVFVQSKGRIATREAQGPEILLMQVLQNALARRNQPVYMYEPMIEKTTVIYSRTSLGTSIAVSCNRNI
jgi:hypothetical protein